MFHRLINRYSPIAILILLLVAYSACSPNPLPQAKKVRIGLVYIGPHELINQIVAGFRDGVKADMGDQPFEIVEKHANGDKSQISPTVNAAIATGLNAIATITTPVSQTALKNAPQSLPVIFVGVTDPIGAGLVKSMDHPELCTGVSDLAPLSKMLSFIKEAMPSVKKIGFPYSPEEQPAIFSRDQMNRLAPGLGIVVDARPVTSKDELPTLLRELVRSNDAIVVGADNGMFEAAPQIAKIAMDAHKPFFAADSSSVKAGAVAGVTIDYNQVGVAGGKLAVRVVKGEKVGSIPVVVMTDGVLELNKASMQKLRLTFTPEILKQVQKTYE